MKELMTKIKGEGITSCIVHLADSANFKGVTPNKLCSGLIGSFFESPNDTIHVTVMGKFKTTRYNGYYRQTREPPLSSCDTS